MSLLGGYLATCSWYLTFHWLLASAQQFPMGMSIDVDLPGLSGSCKTAMNSTVNCDGSLVEAMQEAITLSPDDLSAICVDSCAQSLRTVRENVVSTCSAATDVIVLDGLAYPATYSLDQLQFTQSVICRKDAGTQQFCSTILDSWQNQTNLTSDQLCSDCVLGTLQLDLQSPFRYNDEAAKEFSSLTSSCGKSNYAYTTPTPIARNGTSTTTATATPTPCSDTYTIQAGDDCNKISIAHNVSTYSLLYQNDLQAYCRDFPKAGTNLCLPKQCDIYTVQANDTCYSVAQSQPSHVTITQIIAWNNNLNAECSNINQQVGSQICVSPPGDSLAIQPSNTAANPSSATTPAPAPTNVAQNTTTSCGRYYNVELGDDCSRVTVAQGVSLSDFYFLNPGINENCTNLLAGVSYCVQPVGSITTYASYNGVTGTRGPCFGARAPASCYGDFASLSPTPFVPLTATPTPSGTASNCSQFTTWQNGTALNLTNPDYVNSCGFVAYYYGIKVATLLALNPILTVPVNIPNSNFTDCELQPGYKYCVAGPGEATAATPTMTITSDSMSMPTATATSSTTGSAAPSPTQSGLISSCTKFHQVVAGDGCYDIAAANSISLDNFYAWNPAVGTNCGSLWSGYYVCVGAPATITSASSATTPTLPPSTTSSTALATPTPFQANMQAGCKKFYKAVSGDYCYLICQKNAISQADFQTWNPDVGSDCGGIWLDYYYCVGH